MPYTFNPFTEKLDYYMTSTALSGTISDHGDLTGLLNDTHTQYHTDTRGDIRYYTKTQLNTGQLDNRYYTETEVNTISGALNDKISTTINAVPSSNLSANGPQCNTINAGESITVSNCVYLKSDGEWWKTNASGETTGAGMLAIALENKTDGEVMNVALPGTFIRNDSWTWDMNENSRILYVSCTSGDLTQTVVSGTNNIIRIVGHATHVNRIFFNPEQTIVIHT